MRTCDPPKNVAQGAFAAALAAAHHDWRQTIRYGDSTIAIVLDPATLGVVSDAYAALLAVGHSEMQARAAIDRVLAGKKKFKSVADLIEAIYQQEKD